MFSESYKLCFTAIHCVISENRHGIISKMAPARSAWIRWFLLSLIWGPVPAPYVKHVVIEWAASQQTGLGGDVLKVEGRISCKGGWGCRASLRDVLSSIVLHGSVKASSGRFVLNPQVSSALGEAFLWFCAWRSVWRRPLKGQPGPVCSIC